MNAGYLFEAKIKSLDDFVVGDTGKGNSFNLSITYCGEEKVKLEDCIFYLRVDVGSAPQALVLDHVDAGKIVPVKSGGNDIQIERSSDQKQYFWKISSYDETHFSPEKPIKIEFSNIISKTEPGSVKFVFEAEIDDEKVNTKVEGELVKQSDQPGIVYFYSTTEERQNNKTTPESIVPAAEQILPKETVILKWYIHKPSEMQELKLTQSGRELLSGTDFDTAKGSRKIENINQNTDFVLSGVIASNPEPQEQIVNVDVFKKGWNDSNNAVNGTRLIPSQIFNANNQSIYAVFLEQLSGGNKEAHMYQTGNPFWGWASINVSLPKDFTTSPGVFCDDKLWFIGGSQIDPDITSNKVCYFEANKKNWEELGPTPWRRRMGHACLHLPAGTINNNNEQIWVLGGCDENGNTLQDIWALDVSRKTWSDTGIKLPSKRSMLSCTIFNEQIWICGGAEYDPLEGKIENDIYAFDKAGWKRKDKGLSFIPGQPISACFQVFNDNLHVIGKYKNEDGAISPYYYKLLSVTQMYWSVLPDNLLKGWGDDTVSSYQLLNYDNRLLIAKAMGLDKANDTLKVYVP